MTQCNIYGERGEKCLPKATFFNLPKEKQDFLMKSAMKEFSRVPVYEASISNIVKTANISRGSFYQYFEDKEDLFYYLLEENTKTHSGTFSDILQKNDGHIFPAFTEVFHNMVKEFQIQEKRDFYKNVFLNWNYKMENALSMNISEPDFNQQFDEVKEFINTDSLNIADDDELIHVMQILIAVTMQNLMFTFTKQYSEEVSLKHYQFELHLLKNGLFKEALE